MNDIIELRAINADGDEVVYRRCGAIPDLYASTEGDILRTAVCNIVGDASVRYKNTTLSARCLIADAWLPNWDEHHSGVGYRKGTSLAVENLVPVSGHRGRPAGGELRRLAYLYQSIKLLSDMPIKQSVALVAEEFGLAENTVRKAVLLFQPALLQK